MTDPYEPHRGAAPVPPQVPTVPSAPPTVPNQIPGDPSTPPTVLYPVNYPPVSAPPTYLPVPYPPPAAAYDQPGYYQPGYGQPGQAMAGVDPVTGQPFSDKSKIVAGLLQLGLGFFFTLGGVGRLYAGNTTVGVIQIVASVTAWICLICGFFVFFLTWPIWFGVWLWFVIDGIVMLAGRPVDGQGRPLRA